MKDISEQYIYRIVNQAIDEATNCSNYFCANDTMSEYVSAYKQYKKNHIQLTIFDDPIPSKETVEKASRLCQDLDEYKYITDPYNDKDNELSQNLCKSINEGLEFFKDNITDENRGKFLILQKQMQRHLPQYTQSIKIEDLIRNADIVLSMKKKYDNDRRKNIPATKRYEPYTQYFFNKAFKEEKAHEFDECPEKITLYEKCIELVNCQPSTVGRKKKYEMKKWLYEMMKKTATALKMPELEKKCNTEISRWQRNISNIDEKLYTMTPRERQQYFEYKYK